MRAILPNTRRGEKQQREIMTECFAYAIALVLHDVYGFGGKRIQRTITALNEVMTGYADEHGADLRAKMLDELRGRGIELVLTGDRR